MEDPMTDQKRRLYRSRKSKVIGGVCGGLAEYLGIDVTIVRLVWIFLTILGGSGIILYVLAYFIMPVKPLETDDQLNKEAPDLTPARVFGILFVVIGIALLLNNLDILSFHRWREISWDYSLPSILILV
jgi:phage shock protein C